MANLDPVQIDINLINFFIYGLVKAEMKTTRRTNIISKATFAEAAKKLEEYLVQKGITVKRGETPEQTIENYISVHEQSGLFSRDDFVIEKKENAIQIKVLNCPFQDGSGRLIKEGINRFGCFQMEILRRYIDPEGKKYQFQIENDPGNCVITINENG
ncbi:hypothetical protein GF337_04940 [candidate division KSB1 bacterium]|nr:hypothetical protein [candidate division KSB1 bacterium]